GPVGVFEADVGLNLGAELGVHGAVGSRVLNLAQRDQTIDEDMGALGQGDRAGVVVDRGRVAASGVTMLAAEASGPDAGGVSGWRPEPDGTDDTHARDSGAKLE